MSATNYKNINGVDLDAIYLPRVSTKRADVSYFVNGVDITNDYEPYVAGSTKAQPVLYNNTGTDLSDLFARKGYRQMNYQYYTVAETASQYKNNNNGQVVVTIINANLNSPGTHNYTVTLKQTTVISSQTASFTTNTRVFTFTGLNSGNYTITVKDNSVGGLTDSNRSVTVGYDTGTSATSTIKFFN